ncbi:Chemotaxis protein CheY homolog [Desulfamplus magnetovallimortis]|uniref:Chemotaxis protein CheY homolog n=1 Tax=Desulfamplus magnetovallimortis TaxID=1246637 RepID=A0A1W1HGG6_9BACT|nr:response regulator [Desulfamplus magnetovallimortis]SLM31536.1 Chemotaxis protein CheY homolog [Desulfamplus magnetovallimortis]
MTFSILLVDDSMPMRSVIKKAFKAAGYGTSDFHEAANGKEALDQLQGNWIDIVVTDFTMPVMNGLELIEKMKENDLYRDIPVVVVTTEGSRERVDQFMKSGARGYIKKPFTPEQIRDLITEILGESDGYESFDCGDDDFDF